MCVIVAKPRGIEVPWPTLKNCFDNNPHGAGFTAVTRSGDFCHAKGFFSYTDFFRAFKSFSKCAALIHFRIATHGEKNEEMCHPFEVTPTLHVAHNGIISIDRADAKNKSDTWHFVEKVLKPEVAKDPECIYRPSFKFLLDCTLRSSKLAFIDKRGELTIVNAEDGEYGTGDLERVWFSNATYRYGKSSYSPKWSRKQRKKHRHRVYPCEEGSMEGFYQTTMDLPENHRRIAEDLMTLYGWPEHIVIQLFNEGMEKVNEAIEIERQMAREQKASIE